MIYLQSSEAEMKADNYVLSAATQIFLQYYVSYEVWISKVWQLLHGVLSYCMTFRYLATDKSTHLGIKQPVQNATFTKKLLLYENLFYMILSC